NGSGPLLRRGRCPTRGGCRGSARRRRCCRRQLTLAAPELLLGRDELMVCVLLLAGRVADLLGELGVGGAQLDGIAPEDVAERDSRPEGETEQDCPATVGPYGVPDLVLGTLGLNHGSPPCAKTEAPLRDTMGMSMFRGLL